MKTLQELKPYVGSWQQLFGIKEYEYTAGRAKGVRGFDVKSGGGLAFSVVDRTLDITELTYRGENLSFLSPRGVCAPEYASEEGMDFLKNFTCGAMMTCGLSTIGVPSVDDGVAFGLHGKLPTLRAENVGSEVCWNNGEPTMIIRGCINHSWLYGEKLVLQREIRCGYNSKRIEITDRIHNCGFKEEPFFLLYHINLGYPLVSENSYVMIPSAEFVPGNDVSAAEEEIQARNACQKPVDDYPERVYFHKVRGDETGHTCSALINPDRKLGMVIHSNVSEMPRLTQWKYMQKGEYVVGLSPATNAGFGRAAAHESGEMQLLKPDETRTVHICFEVLDGQDDIDRITAEIRKLAE